MFSVILFDKTCRIVFASHILPPLSRREVIGRLPWEPHLVNPRQAEIWQAAAGRLFSTGEQQTFFIETVCVGTWRNDLYPAQNLPLIAAVCLAQQVPDEFSTLTGREIEVAQLIVAGKSIKQIAASLSIKRGTVDNHRAAIARKLHVHTAELDLHLGRHASAFR